MCIYKPNCVVGKILMIIAILSCVALMFAVIEYPIICFQIAGCAAILVVTCKLIHEIKKEM